MEELSVVWFIIVLMGLVIWLSYVQLRTMYDRHLRGYHQEIREYLISNSLKLVDIRYPNQFDWMDNCFPEPYISKVGGFMLQINDINPFMDHKQYKIVDALTDTDQRVRVWIEIDTSFFHSTKLKFKQKLVNTFFAPMENIPNEGSVTVTTKCPACGWTLDGSETQCPECELHFR